MFASPLSGNATITCKNLTAKPPVGNREKEDGKLQPTCRNAVTITCLRKNIKTWHTETYETQRPNSRTPAVPTAFRSRSSAVCTFGVWKVVKGLSLSVPEDVIQSVMLSSRKWGSQRSCFETWPCLCASYACVTHIFPQNVLESVCNLLMCGPL